MLSHPIDAAVTDPSPKLPWMRTGLQFHRSDLASGFRTK
jgi:hypothetical protein